MSENAIPLRVVALFGLYRLKVSVVAVSTRDGEGENDLLMVAALIAVTVRVAEAVLPVNPLVEDTAPLVFA